VLCVESYLIGSWRLEMDCSDLNSKDEYTRQVKMLTFKSYRVFHYKDLNPEQQFEVTIRLI
jgi:hypothetical protein